MLDAPQRFLPAREDAATAPTYQVMWMDATLVRWTSEARKVSDITNPKSVGYNLWLFEVNHTARYNPYVTVVLQEKDGADNTNIGTHSEARI